MAIHAERTVPHLRPGFDENVEQELASRDEPGSSRGMTQPTNQPMLEANKEVPRVKHPFNASSETQPIMLKYCDRCARRSQALLYDDLTRQELCQDCCNRLKRRREVASYPATKKM